MVPGRRQNIIGRLHPDGSLDVAYNPGADNAVFALAEQPNGKILIGGAFTGLGGGTGETPRNYLGRLNTDGSLDMSFDPGADFLVNGLGLQADGKILVGGYFSGLGGGTGTTARNRIGRLNNGEGGPSAFIKVSPANGVTGWPVGLLWGQSFSATNYEFCIDTTNDNACSTWINNDNSTFVYYSELGLTWGQTYYWQVRATNDGGTTYANGSPTVYWSFTTPTQPDGLVFTNPGLIEIPADSPTQTSGVAAPYPSSISVSGVSGSVQKVTVSIHGFSHTYPQDVAMVIVAPGGQAFAFMDRLGDSVDAVNIDLTFSDDAFELPPGTLTAGTYRPSSSFGTTVFPAPGPGSGYAVPEPAGSATFASAFGGTNPNGTWSLFVLDDAGADFGEALNGWSLTIMTQGGASGSIQQRSVPQTLRSNTQPLWNSVGRQATELLSINTVTTRYTTTLVTRAGSRRERRPTFG